MTNQVAKTLGILLKVNNKMHLKKKINSPNKNFTAVILKNRLIKDHMKTEAMTSPEEIIIRDIKDLNNKEDTKGLNRADITKTEAAITDLNKVVTIKIEAAGTTDHLKEIISVLNRVDIKDLNKADIIRIEAAITDLKGIISVRSKVDTKDLNRADIIRIGADTKDRREDTTGLKAVITDLKADSEDLKTRRTGIKPF